MRLITSRKFTALSWCVLACLAALAIEATARKHATFSNVSSAFILGVGLGIFGWLCFLGLRGHDINLRSPSTVLYVAGAFLMRRIIAEAALASPITVIIGAFVTLLFFYSGMRRWEVRQAPRIS